MSFKTEKELILSFNFLGVEPFQWRGNASHFSAPIEGADGWQVEGGWVSLLDSVRSTGSFFDGSPDAFVRDLEEAVPPGIDLEDYYTFYFHMVNRDNGIRLYGAPGEYRAPELEPFTRQIFATVADYVKETYTSHPYIAVESVAGDNRARLYERMIDNIGVGHFRRLPTVQVGDAHYTFLVPADAAVDLTADDEEAEVVSSLITEKSGGVHEISPDMMSKQIVKRAVARYGVTDDPGEAFFVLPDGSYLNGSGSSDGRSYGGSRGVDHHEVESLIPGFEPDKYRSRYQALMAFCAQAGAVRVDFSTGAVSAVGCPNRYQLRALAEGFDECGVDPAYLDAVDKSGNVIASTELVGPTYDLVEAFFSDPKGFKGGLDAGDNGYDF